MNSAILTHWHVLPENEQVPDVVLEVVGGTGQGVIEAAKDTGFWAVGVDSDQDFLAPGFVLTSMLKRGDIAVYDLILRFVTGELEGGRVAQCLYSDHAYVRAAALME